MYDRIHKWYNQGLWTIDMVANAVKKGIITADEYESITGEVYNG